MPPKGRHDDFCHSHFLHPRNTRTRRIVSCRSGVSVRLSRCLGIWNGAVCWIEFGDDCCGEWSRSGYLGPSGIAGRLHSFVVWVSVSPCHACGDGRVKDWLFGSCAAARFLGRYCVAGFQSESLCGWHIHVFKFFILARKSGG